MATANNMIDEAMAIDSASQENIDYSSRNKEQIAEGKNFTFLNSQI